MENFDGQNPYQEDEITLKELLLKAQEFFQEVLKNWMILGGTGLVFAALLVLRFFLADPEYKADVAFTLNEDAARSGISAILGQFGSLLGGSTASPVESIVRMTTSKKIMAQTMMREVEIDDKKDVWLNHYIRIYELHEKWADSDYMKDLKDFYFKKKNYEDFSHDDKKAFMPIYNGILENRLTVANELGSNVISYSFVSKSEGLSVEFTNNLFEELDNHYVNSIKRERLKTLDLVRNRVDSISNVLIGTEARLARRSDSNKGFFLQSQTVDINELQRNVQMLTLMKGEAVKNLEVARFSYESTPAFLTQLDGPIYPLKAAERSLIMTIIIGLFLGGFLATVFVLGRKILRDTLRDDEVE